MASYSSNKKKSFTSTTNTANANTIQAAGNVNSTANNINGNVSGGLVITTTDYGAIKEGMALASDASANAFEVSKQALASNEATLSKYFDQANTNNKNFYNIAANATGAKDWQKMAVLGGIVLAIFAIYKKGKK